MKAIFDALNIVYDEDEKRGFIRLNLVSLAFTLGAASSCCWSRSARSSCCRSCSPISASPPSSRPDWLPLLRWPVLFVLVMLGLAVLYRFGPSRRDAEVALAQRRQRVRGARLARGLGAVLLVSVEFRRLQRDLRLARRRHRPDDVDVALDHRRFWSAPSSIPRSSTRPRATPRSGSGKPLGRARRGDGRHGGAAQDELAKPLAEAKAGNRCSVESWRPGPGFEPGLWSVAAPLRFQSATGPRSLFAARGGRACKR